MIGHATYEEHDCGSELRPGNSMESTFAAGHAAGIVSWDSGGRRHAPHGLDSGHR